jgi:hypothetical protein
MNILETKVADNRSGLALYDPHDENQQGSFGQSLNQRHTFVLLSFWFLPCTVFPIQDYKNIKFINDFILVSLSEYDQ